MLTGWVDERMIRKVLAYIVRDASPEPEVLVFSRIDQPGDAPEVPGGSVQEAEDLKSAVHREIKEETGIANITIVGRVATAPFHADWRNEWQERNVFHVVAPAGLPDSWKHVISGGIEDRGQEVLVRWMPLSEAQHSLRWGQGQWLERINEDRTQ